MSIQDCDHLFFVMEFGEQDLKQALDSNTEATINFENYKIILYNMLCAMNFIHSANIIHRDIKPANILFKNDCTIKLCDFGLSRTSLMDDEGKSNDLKSKMTDLNKSKRALKPQVEIPNNQRTIY